MASQEIALNKEVTPEIRQTESVWVWVHRPFAWHVQKKKKKCHSASVLEKELSFLFFKFKFIRKWVISTEKDDYRKNFQIRRQYIWEVMKA
jgi:hypothetical protein